MPIGTDSSYGQAIAIEGDQAEREIQAIVAQRQREQAASDKATREVWNPAKNRFDIQTIRLGARDRVHPRLKQAVADARDAETQARIALARAEQEARDFNDRNGLQGQAIRWTGGDAEIGRPSGMAPAELYFVTQTAPYRAALDRAQEQLKAAEDDVGTQAIAIVKMDTFLANEEAAHKAIDQRCAHDHAALELEKVRLASPKIPGRGAGVVSCQPHYQSGAAAKVWGKTMPWKGPGRRYYYQSQRVGKRIVYTYYGTGDIAALIAQIDQLDQQERRQAQLQAKRMLAELAKRTSEPGPMREHARLVANVVQSALTAAGYHRHKRQWRKRRMTNGSGTRAEFTALWKQASKRDAPEADLLALQKFVAAYPDFGRGLDLAERAIAAMIKEMPAEPMGKAIATGRADALRKELSGDSPTPIERLLIDQVLLSYLHLNLVEYQHSAFFGGAAPA